MAGMERYCQDRDVLWMHRALELARRGLGTTSPNPPVGAVIVRDGHLLGEGYHARAGEPHAERQALADVWKRGREGELKGATLYVTLEPCSSYGRTPPCTEAILGAGIGEVVYGAVDPDERHRGRADALLQQAGVRVRSGICAADCEQLLRPWMFSVREKRPWVVAKIASTLDGRIVRQKERWLTGREARQYVHQLRLESDAILVGGQTVRSDNPALTIREPLTPLPSKKEQPWRIVLTRNRASLPESCRLFCDEWAHRTLVYERVKHLEEWLRGLYEEYGIVQLMLECGGRLLRSFLEEGLVQEWVQFIAPLLEGGEQLLLPGDFLSRELALEGEKLNCLGKDVLVRGILR